MTKKVAGRVIEIVARGVCVKAEKILLCRNRKHGNVYLPGGHVDWGEESRHAVAREWQEELDLPCRTGRFLGVIEQGYEARSGPTSEISLIFEVHCPALSATRNPPSAEDHLAFEWVPLNNLESSGLLPAALVECLPSWWADPAAAAKRWCGWLD